MARCGCADDEANRSVMRAGCGIAVSGAGTNADPRRVELIASDCLCGVMRSCVTDVVCAGLSTADGCLGVDISANAGNRLNLGADGGLFADCGTVAVNECVARVSALPAFVCGGGFGAGLNVAEDGVRASYAQAVALGVDLVLAKVFRLCDGAFYVGPSRQLSDPRYRLSSEDYIKPTGPVARTSTNQALALQISPDSSYATCTWEDQGLIPGLEPLTGVLTECRSRVPLSVELPTGDGTSGTTDQTATELLGVLTQNCALDRVIVHVEGTATDAERARLEDFRTAGYETGVYVATDDEAAVHTPAKLAAEKVKWVYTPKTLSDVLVRGYVTAGLDVLLARCFQQVDVTRAEGLGARGVLAEDPAYVCGDPCHAGVDPWCSDAVPSGQITANTITTGQIRGNRGFKAGGECGWAMQNTGPLPAVAQATLLGWAGWGRLAPPVTYTYTWEMRTPELVGRTGSQLGLLVACTDDTLPLQGARTAGADTLDPARVSGYLVTTTLGWSAAATIMRVWKLTKGQTPVQLGEFFQGGTPFEPNVWLRARVEVTPTQIIFGLGVNDAGFPTWGSVTVDDAEHRGGTVWAYAKAEGDNAPVTITYDFRNFVRR